MALMSRRKTRTARRGTAAVEAALVLPMTLLFLMGIIEYGRYVMTLQVVTNAARNGARYALAHVSPVILNGVTYGNGTSDVQNIVTTALGGQSLSGQNVQVFACDALGNNQGAWTSATPGGSICVQISGNYIPVISQFLYLPASIPVSVQSVARVESS
jgi:Flp pilus assembly protein TadG